MQKGAGQRDRRIRIERYLVTQNALNEDVHTWAELATVWASRMDVSDGEKLRASEIGAEISTRFSILWSTDVADVNPKDRVEYPVGSGTYFDIFSVKEIGRREGIEITATARADQ